MCCGLSSLFAHIPRGHIPALCSQTVHPVITVTDIPDLCRQSFRMIWKDHRPSFGCPVPVQVILILRITVSATGHGSVESVGIIRDPILRDPCYFLPKCHHQHFERMILPGLGSPRISSYLRPLPVHIPKCSPSAFFPLDHSPNPHIMVLPIHQ